MKSHMAPVSFNLALTFKSKSHFVCLGAGVGVGNHTYTRALEAQFTCCPEYKKFESKSQTITTIIKINNAEDRWPLNTLKYSTGFRDTI